MAGPRPHPGSEEPRVRRWSTIAIRGCIYSVPSRLIGYLVEVRIYLTQHQLEEQVREG
ncbi:MAG: hypothetical protein IPK80_01405 [Nannocystis sp.]|nr:hypothetical protein [Nannocystis sp.]